VDKKFLWGGRGHAGYFLRMRLASGIPLDTYFYFVLDFRRVFIDVLISKI
jgi:hypothetical protein